MKAEVIVINDNIGIKERMISSLQKCQGNMRQIDCKKNKEGSPGIMPDKNIWYIIFVVSQDEKRIQTVDASSVSDCT